MEHAATAPAAPVRFETHPSRYVHWRLEIEPPVARLLMDVQEDAAAAPRLPAQAQQLRPRRRHRARRRDPAPALRASRGAGGRGDERQGPHLLLGRQHLHARLLDPRLQGELLQVHQRDAPRPSRTPRALRPQVPGRGQRHLRGRRLRAGARLRRDPARGRRLVRGEPARGAAARRAARHRRPHARRRQAQGAPRPGRRVLEPRRGRQGQARGGVAPRGRDGAALEVRGARARARQGAGRGSPPRRRARASRWRRSAARYTRRRASSTATSRSTIDAGARVGAAHACAARKAASPRRAAAMRERGSELWALRAFRELDDALLDLRFNRPEIGVVVLQTRGDAGRVLAADAALLRATATTGSRARCCTT